MAQDAQVSNVTGRLQTSERFLHGYVVELEPSGAHAGPSAQADVQSDGEFLLRNVEYGEYVLRVTTYQGGEVARQLVSIREHNAMLEVRMPPSAPMPTGETVSLGTLLHPPARKAVAAAAAAQRLSERGERDRAVEELQKALRISPEYAAAHSNLGVEYLRMGRYEEAKGEIERALEIAGPNAIDYSNLAFALAGMQRVGEAAQTARRALALDGRNAGANYLLGSILALRAETRGEGVARLEIAAETLPSARRELEKWRR